MSETEHGTGSRRRALIDAFFFATVFAVVWTVGYLLIGSGGVPPALGTALIAWVASFATTLYFLGGLGPPGDGRP